LSSVAMVDCCVGAFFGSKLTYAATTLFWGALCWRPIIDFLTVNTN
jgi:hypothetical protein